MKNNSDYEFPWDHSSSEEDKAVKGFFCFVLLCFVDKGEERNTDLFVSFSAGTLGRHYFFKDINAHATSITFN